ncbi:hypothetical protein IIB34_05560 [PVC group bacterium]|nr:hypothetical protein [PVC group bacterium]
MLTPATGEVEYEYENLSLNLKEDVWVKAIEFIPTSYGVLHHMHAYVRHPLSPKFRIKKFISRLFKKRNVYTDKWRDVPDARKNYFAVVGPRFYLNVFPEGTGKYIPKGSFVRVQIHHATTGKAEENKIQIGFYFHDQIPENELFTYGIATQDIVVPPYAKVAMSIDHVFDYDVVVYALIPHMHYRGKSFKFILTDPDGFSETLLSIPDFNFYWQNEYELEIPRVIKKGSKMICEAVYDNTDANPLNPDSSQWVYWGFRTVDKMFIGYMNLTRPVKENYSILGFIPL